MVAENRLPISVEEFCRAVNEHVIVSVTDADGRIVYVNPRFCDASGYTEDELLGQTHSLLKSDRHDAAFFAEMWNTIVAGETWHGEMCNRRRDGGDYWVKATIVPIRDASGRISHYISTRTDITEVKQQLAEIDSLISEQDELMRLAPFGVARLRHRRFVRVNDAFTRILGFERGELLGRLTRDIYLSQQQFEDVGRIAYEPLQRGDMVQFELELKRKDGRHIWAIAGTCSLNRADPMSETLYMIQDISAHKTLEAELATALRQAQEAERAKSTFLDSMTHELHTPLNGILGTGQIIAMCVEDAELKGLVELSNEAARTLLRGIDNALLFAAMDDNGAGGASSMVNVGEIVAIAMRKETDLAKKFCVELINATPADASLVVRDSPKRLAQMIELLLDNAIRYNRPQGKVTLALESRATDTVLSITDTGIGMTTEQLAALATPFTRFCQDGNRPGLGLGIALTARLARRLGAQLHFDSEPGSGTTARLTFPTS